MKLLRIRHARETDFPGVQKLQEHWYAENNTWDFTPESPEALEDHLGRLFLVAEYGGKLIGYALGEIRDTPSTTALDPKTASFELMDLYVHPDHRCKGIGGLMLRAVIRNARKSGVNQYKLHSANKDIPRIHAFYRKHGFETIGIDMVFRVKEK